MKRAPFLHLMIFCTLWKL